MAGTILLKNALGIYTFNAKDEIITDGYVLIEGNKIKKIGRSGMTLPRADSVIDLKNKIIVPGLVNVHHHFFQSVTRAVPITQKCSILEWLKYLYCLWAFLTPEDIRTATRIAVGELLLSGCTTSSDFFYLFPQKNKQLFDVEIETAANMGIRLHAVRGCLPVLEGSLNRELKALNIDTSLLIEDKIEILAESERVIDKYHDESPFSMTQVGIGPTTVDYKDIKFSRKLKELAREKNLLFHFHLHPRPDERELCFRLYNQGPLEHLERIGWLDKNTFIAHATNHSPEDIAVLARNGVSISHSPSCHMRMGYNVAPIPDMRKRGIIVGLGVDGGASNDSGNMLAELRSTLLVHRIRGVHTNLDSDSWFNHRDVFEMATKDGARILGREDVIGSLEEGKAADLAAFDMDKLGYAGAGSDPLSSLVFCGLDYRSALTMVNGKILVQDGVVLGVDERELVREANSITKRLMDQATLVTGLDFRHPA
jgi:8-oxoguanine deaminase